MNAPAVLELPLDDSLLKVLSSDSRREILRLLRERRMTGAELAARLELGKPAVAEHLKKLQDAELIERFDDPERRWVYYSLSARGRGILEPQRVRFYLVMSVAAAALMVGVVLGLGLFVALQGTGSAPDAAADVQGLGARGADGSLLEPQGSASVPVQPVPGANGAAAPPASTVSSPPPSPATTQPEPGGSEEAVAADPQVEEPPATADGPGQSQPASGSFLHASPSDRPRKAVLAYQARDVDAANHTVRLHTLVLDVAMAQDANLTQAVKDAADVPGIGILVRVPDAVTLPPEVAATLSLPELDAALVALAAEASAAEPAPSAGEPESPPATSTEAAAAPAAESSEEPAAEAILPEETPAGTADPPAPQSAAAQAPGPVPARTQDDAGASVGSAGKSALQGAAPVAVAEPAAAPPSSPRAAIPLVALIGAAVMVSVYLPSRRAAS